VAPATSGGGHGCKLQLATKKKEREIFVSWFWLGWGLRGPRLLKKKIHSGGVRAPINHR
jgi:hypothetical protein